MPSPTIDRLELPDVNVLLALVHPDHVRHRQASDWFAGTARFATTPVTESGLARLALGAAVVGARAASPAAALASLRSIRADPRSVFLADNTSLAEPTIQLSGFAGYRQVTDLHLVNLAAVHGAVLATFDPRIPAALLHADRRHVRVIG